MKAKEWVCRVKSQEDVNRSSQRCQPDPSATLMSMWARATGQKLYSYHEKLGNWDYEDFAITCNYYELSSHNDT